MVNLKHKLTVDDLIVEYMMYKVKNGYEPSFLTSEFIDFLYFFENKMPVEDVLYENDKLFQRFFERKAKSDWFKVPHMDMVYSEKDHEYLIKANYKLSDYDKSIINTYFMDKNIGRNKNHTGQVYKIRNIIGEFLKNSKKRTIDESKEINNDDLIVAKNVTAKILVNIWEHYVKEKIEAQKWPIQCKDINKYLFKVDLAKIIGLKSIKSELLEIYKVFSKRLAILYSEDKNLKIKTSSDSYLARSNYELLIQGYEEIINKVFSDYTKILYIDFSNLELVETNTIDCVYYWDEEPDVKVTTSKINNKEIKKLAKKFEQ